MSEKIDEVAKFIALQKIKSYKQYVESLKTSIPLRNLEDIVSKATYRAITEQNIKELCCNAYIDGIGNTGSGSHYTRSIFTLNRIKNELTRKTIESIKESLAAKIRDEILGLIKLSIHGKFELNIIFDAFNVVSTGILATMLLVMASLVNPIAEIVGLVAAIGAALITIAATPNVNSRSWREDVAVEIYQYMLYHRNEIIKGISSSIGKILRDTSDQLTTVVERLENFQRRIDL